jgi:DTW domain-containing protein
MRVMCYRCFWPQPLCWCGSLRPMPTSTRFVFLMHPKEFKQEKAGTGRLTHLCLPNSEIQVGVGFDDHEPVQALLRDPANHCVLLYPGPAARNLSRGELTPADYAGKRLVVLLLDATWACARKMLRLSATLQTLPRIMFTPTAPSRFIIKQQPQEGCLSTLEAVHETLLVLERGGLDVYPDPAQLLSIFERMQRYQIECAKDPERKSYRGGKGYSDPATRRPARGHSASRRNYFIKTPPAP